MGKLFVLPLETRMILGALYVLQRRLCAPVESIDFTGVRHAGADRLARHVPSGGDWQTVEIIVWPLGEHSHDNSPLQARFAFDAQTFRVLQITVRDNPSGLEGVIKLSDYRNVGGLVWPCTVEVHLEGLSYRETWTDWEVSP